MPLDDLLDFCHKLPEYVETKSSIPIDPAAILRAEGVDEDTIDDIEAHAKERGYLAVLPG